MLNVFVAAPEGLRRVALDEDGSIPADALWIDLLEPTEHEERAVEALLGLDVPTREEMREIEASNRLYEDRGALYMTATVAARLDSQRPETTAVTFILANGRLVTNRHVDTRPFQQFVAYAGRHPAACVSATTVLAGLVDALIARIADILERVAMDLDAISSAIFMGPESGNGEHRKRSTLSRDLRRLIERIGFSGELNSKTRESLMSLDRMLMFVQQATNAGGAGHGTSQELRERFGSLSRDVASLSDYAGFLGSKATFLLEATLGLVNVEQNNIIKLFSVAAVLFLPPTLIASIYGMNFRAMPELDWLLGYPFALMLMIASMIITFVMFKRKGWL
ncbi:MAG: magnesium transporter [Proteobacteria bacterium]|nr:MAG: magnesium transporter [Pseudomonadota bacterium]